MPQITLGGRTFPCTDVPPKGGLLMQIADAERRHNDNAAMALYYRLCTKMLADDADRVAFDDAFGDADFDEIGSALEKTAQSYGVDPTSPGQPSSSDSAAGPPTVASTSKVVSLSRGTVEIQEQPQSSTA